MTELLCLIFDENAHLLYRFPVNAPPSLPALPESASDDPAMKEAERRFLASLPSGDRKHFLRFCARPIPDTTPSTPCALFSILGFPPFRYAFCEKNRFGGRMLTMVYLAKEAHSLYRMMSPAALQCTRLSDRLTREILLCLGHPSHAIHSLTHETILALQYFPTVLRSFMEPSDIQGLCDIERITELVVGDLQKTPPFRNTTLDLHPTDCVPSRRIIDLPVEVYVHLLMSVLTALLSISADHVIGLEVCPFPSSPDGDFQDLLSVVVKITTRLRDPGEYRSGSEHLPSLAVPGSEAETILAAASVFAAAANITPLYYIRHADSSLQLSLTIGPTLSAEERRQLPEFRFRDPYRAVRTLVAEFLDFLEKM